MKTIFITEKPSVAQEYRKVLQIQSHEKTDGYIEGYSPVLKKDVIITWAVGHLIGISSPEEQNPEWGGRWSTDKLPMIPQQFKYEPQKSTYKQFKIVKSLYTRKDVGAIYYAGDSGREGIYIQALIRNQIFKTAPKLDERVVWIDSYTEESILGGIRDAKPYNSYQHMVDSGYARAMSDWLIGMNFTEAFTLTSGKTLNTGRVMTPTLAMIVQRQREIENFTKTYYYGIKAGENIFWKAEKRSRFFESDDLYNENGFLKKEKADALVTELMQDQKLTVEDVKVQQKTEYAPYLFNLADLQAYCSKTYKISPANALSIAQSLYEKKFTTYPRTDCRFLSSAVAVELKSKGYNVPQRYIDDSKVTDHYAIIPTGQLTELSGLTSLQRAVFELIVRRFLSIFYPPAEYENVKLVVDVDKESFFASSKVLKSEGYLQVANPPKKKSFEESNARILGKNSETADSTDENSTANGSNDEIVVNPKVMLELADKLKAGDEIACQGYNIKFGKTSPPKRYTSGSMVLAMENAGQLIEDEELREQIKGSGIGTSATRAEIIQKLVRIGYLNLNKKTQILTPESLGEMVFEVVYMTVPALLNPKMTANWEKGLDGITRGTVDFWEYRGKLESFIRKETEKMIEQNLRPEIAERISSFAGKNARGAAARRKIGVKCPVCGGEIVTTPFGYGCANYKNDKSGCNFNIGQVAGLDIPEEQVKKLIEEGITDTIRGFKSKSGKRFDACLKLNKDEQTNKVSATFDFENVKPQKVEGIVCPDCGGDIYVSPYGYRCANYNRQTEDGCHFFVGRIADKQLSQVQFLELMANGRTETIKGFKSKSGKRFNACLVLKKEPVTEGSEKMHTVVAFDFDNVEDEIIKDVVCPLCGGQIKKTSFGYGCVNYKGDEPGSCRFSVGQIAGKTITAANLKQLLNDKKTETIRGFKSKSGKRFDACLVLKEDENKKLSVQFDFDHVEPKTVKDVVCPKCGGKIQVAPFGFVCENNRRDDPESCRFMVGKVASVKIKESVLKELLTKKKTEVISGFVSKTGMKFDAPLKLTEDGDIAFDFPEKPKPIETNVLCPKCGRPLKKTQWKYECECGFNVWHTVAKVELSEEILTELFTTGKTKKKVTGFTSKAGNVFDTCLKFENDQISFDFDNPGEEEVQSTAEVHNNADAQNNADAYNNAEVQSTADDAPDKTTMNNTTMDEMGIPEEFLAGFDMAADSAQADDVSEAAFAAAHELFGE